MNWKRKILHYHQRSQHENNVTWSISTTINFVINIISFDSRERTDSSAGVWSLGDVCTEFNIPFVICRMMRMPWPTFLARNCSVKTTKCKTIDKPNMQQHSNQKHTRHIQYFIQWISHWTSHELRHFCKRWTLIKFVLEESSVRERLLLEEIRHATTITHAHTPMVHSLPIECIRKCLKTD